MSIRSGKSSEYSVVVYCASSAQIGQCYIDAATLLGKLLAENGITCINGAGKQGLMGALNDAVLRHGGKVKGVIPRFMVDAGWGHDLLTETIVTGTLHERKAAMADHSDAVIALPGGVGTLEELAEIITWKQLGLYQHPIVLLNTNGYYNPLLAFFDQMIEEKFMKSESREMWQVASTPAEVIALLHNFPDRNPVFDTNHGKEL